MLHHICVLKYNIRKQNCDHLKYYDFRDIRRREEESNVGEDEDFSTGVYSNKVFKKEKPEDPIEYIRQTYFIDLNGEI